MKLTSAVLKKIIEEEVEKMKGGDAPADLKSAAKADETDADEFAGSLEKKIDYVKANKLKEAKLIAEIKKLRTERAKVLKSIHATK
jgi:hypothetical protein